MRSAVGGTARKAQPASVTRIGLATLAAAAAAPAPVLPLDPGFYAAAFVVALVHALALGLPLYWWLSRTRRLTLWAALGGSFLVAVVPVTLYLGLRSLEPVPGVDEWLGGVQTREDGRTTLLGWLMILVTGLEAGLFGLFGGVAFWCVMRRHAAPRTRFPSTIG